MMAGKPTSVERRKRLVDGADDAARGHLEADPLHRLLEQLAVLGLLDGVGVGADHLDAVASPGRRSRPASMASVEGGLAAQGRQQRVGPLLLDDLLDASPA